MLAVLEQAQAAGQQSQHDAQIGQASIFDMLEPAAGGVQPSQRQPDPPIPLDEFDQRELLAVEKEAIGLFISTHPLKEVREALDDAVDCTLDQLAERRDGDRVTVGGIITSAKRIRTKSGSHMMFAGLGDLQGEIELLLFEKVLNDNEQLLVVDEMVLVSGRVDHKDKQKTVLVVQRVERFEPSAEQVEAARERAAASPQGPQPLRLHVDATAGGVSARLIEDLKHVLANHAGESEVVLNIVTSAGARTLRFGDGYRVAPTPSLRAELEHILGPAALRAAAAA
ncbi:unannotated protein [freshwater metagenome]|uniref:Unannotated protein n=1 Tax=freshwater metagenome TaxID=449393 RepID=A0A6J7DVK2_9ZZZZ